MTNDMPESSSVPASTRRIPLAIGAVLVGGAIGFAGIYGIGGLKHTSTGDPACRAAVDTAQRIAPLAHGEVAALTMATTPLPKRIRTRVPMNSAITSARRFLDIAAGILSRRAIGGAGYSTRP